MIKGIDITDLDVKGSIKSAYNYTINHGKRGLFVTVNIILYGITAGLSILRLFGLI